MKRTGFGLAFTILLFAGGAEASSLEFLLNDYSVQGRYHLTISQDEYGASGIGARLLYNDDEETLLGSLGFDFSGEPGNVPGLELGVVARGTGGTTDDSKDFLVLDVGGQASYYPPALQGLGIAARIHWAPKLLSFIDAERMLEAGVTVGYALTPRIRLLLAYQVMRTDFEDEGTWTIDEGVRGGFEARF